jgi:cytochrome c-type biogenesis protein CcmH/NrfG
MRLLARGALALVAAVAVAWFALGAYQSHAVSGATSTAGRGRLTAAEARHADSLLNDAGTLNPDQGIDVLRAQVALAAGDSARARQILNDVVAREPQDLDAWIALAKASTDNFRQRQIALLHILKLAPPAAPVG